MHIHTLKRWQHRHRYNIDDGRGERNTRRVIMLTLSMMIIEVAAGYVFGSMALLADGWHMGTHAVALGITAFADYYARKHSDNPNYSFGTGKVGVLGGFASGLVIYWIANNTITFTQQYLIMRSHGYKPDVFGNIREGFKRRGGSAK